jgi:DNA-binding GntR family transcriptional regulator
MVLRPESGLAGTEPHRSGVSPSVALVAQADGRGRPSAMTEVTQILASIEQGDAQVAEHLLPLVYAELRRLAAQKLAREARPDPRSHCPGS